MDPNCPPPPPRQKIPLDGPGPRGVPDCYYTSRVLNSTYRYARFIKKLRITEEEERKGLENKLKEIKDQQISDFFIRCDRRSLLNDVAARVELCMKSYEEDLIKKRQRLKEMLTKEEEKNIEQFVIQAQAAAGIIWQEKLARLEYLLEKRRKEHEEKYKDTPISKCTHVLPCIWKLRAKEAEDIQKYQMREKVSRRLQEEEFNKMWYEVAMKEAEALSRRLELDAMERYRRDMECKHHSDMILAQRARQKEIDRENLKKEQLAMQAKFAADMQAERDEENMRRDKAMEAARERNDSIVEARELRDKLLEEEKKVNDTWLSLAGQSKAGDDAKIARMRKMKAENADCNRHMQMLRDQYQKFATSDNDALIEAEAKRQQDILDKKRCDYLLWSQKQNRDVRTAMVDQIKERAHARENLKKRMEEEDEYHAQLGEQLKHLCDNKALEEAKERKRHQRNLIQQIEYNKLLKERALQEEMDQRKKAAIATKEYEEEIKRMLARPFYTEEVHPFMRQMIGPDGRNVCKFKEKCPCSKQDWCKPSKNVKFAE